MPTCTHSRTRLIAKDKDAEYVECLDCGALLEAEELNAKTADTKSAKEKQGPEGPANESLSDA